VIKHYRHNRRGVTAIGRHCDRGEHNRYVIEVLKGAEPVRASTQWITVSSAIAIRTFRTRLRPTIHYRT
jgi:hypothetical protein